jgi:hypothetical protein
VKGRYGLRVARRRAPVLPTGVVLPRAEWLDLGVHTRRLASPEFLRIIPGYFTMSAAPASLSEICRVLQSCAFPASPVTHSTAALLHGIPLPSQLEDGVGLLGAGARFDELGRREIPSTISADRITDPFAGVEGRTAGFPRIHLAVPPGTRTRAGGVVVVHRTERIRVVERDGILVSDALETLRQLAQVLPVWDMTAAIDATIGPGGVLERTGLDEVREFSLSSACEHMPGTPLLRRAAELARAHVESVGETHMRLIITGAGFPEPVPNLVQVIPATGRMRRLDGALPAWMIGLEYDGAWRRKSARQWEEDRARADDLASAGWELRRFTHRDRRHPTEALLKLRSALQRKGAAVPTVERIRSFTSELRRRRPALLYGPSS